MCASRVLVAGHVTADLVGPAPAGAGTSDGGDRHPRLRRRIAAGFRQP